MTTSNKLISEDWVKIADYADLKVLITWGRGATVEIATTNNDVLPEVSGHVLHPGDAITRALLGDGFIWMRVAVGSYSKTTTVVVTK